MAATCISSKYRINLLQDVVIYENCFQLSHSLSTVFSSCGFLGWFKRLFKTKPHSSDFTLNYYFLTLTEGSRLPSGYRKNTKSNKGRKHNIPSEVSGKTIHLIRLGFTSLTFSVDSDKVFFRFPFYSGEDFLFSSFPCLWKKSALYRIISSLWTRRLA